MDKIKVNIDVNNNKSKKGLKIQFTSPKFNTNNNTNKHKYVQFLQDKLTKALSEHGLTINFDPDVPYSDAIGFSIPIEDFKVLITKIIQDEKDKNF